MARYLLGVLTLICGALAAMYFWIGVPGIYREQGLEKKPELHIYKDPSRPVSDIRVLAFYFVPNNKRLIMINNWREVFEKNLSKLQEFHKLQLQGLAPIHYELYPEPIIGREDNRFYDTDITQHGNPEALRRVALELEGRVLGSSGDLFRKDFPSKKDGAYQVLLIMYEGVGASGSENVALVSRVFLSDPRYQEVSASTMAHEFYHTLGLPDAYEPPTAIATSQDIMGLGRNRSIEKAFIERSTLKQLGF